MQALFSTLVGALQVSFTATTEANSEVLTNVSSLAGLFLGLPVFGPGMQRECYIEAIDTVGGTVTLTEPALASGTAVALTTGFQTTGRRIKFWSDVAAQPALFLRGMDEDLEYQNIIQQAQTIRAEVWVYANAGSDPDAVPESLLNNILDALQAAFAPDDPMQQRFTLGGLVFWCRIAGRLDKLTGDIDSQAIAVVPVEITVP